MKHAAAFLGLALAAAIAGAVALGGTTTDGDDPPRFPEGLRGTLEERLLQERQWLDNHGVKRIGQGYACAVVYPRRGPRPDPRLTIFVTDSAAAERARPLAEALTAPGRVEVARTSSRFRMAVMRRIQADTENGLPSDARNVSLGFEGFMGVRNQACPSLVIALPLEGHAPESVERWAHEAVTRHGADRVVLKRVKGESRSE